MSGVTNQEEDKKPTDQSAHINLKVKGQVFSSSKPYEDHFLFFPFFFFVCVFSWAGYDFKLVRSISYVLLCNGLCGICMLFVLDRSSDFGFCLFSVENLLEFWLLYDGVFLSFKFDGILIGWTIRCMFSCEWSIGKLLHETLNLDYNLTQYSKGLPMGQITGLLLCMLLCIQWDCKRFKLGFFQSTFSISWVLVELTVFALHMVSSLLILFWGEGKCSNGLFYLALPGPL